MAPQPQPQPQQQQPGGANTPKPDSNKDCKDKSDDATNLTNPHDYQTNGFKKHRDVTPI